MKAVVVTILLSDAQDWRSCLMEAGNVLLSQLTQTTQPPSLPALSPPAADGHSLPPVESKQAILTDRETQIICMVAEGSTNRAIACALTLSEKTVARHIANIFNKLDVENRTAAAAWAARQNLVPERRAGGEA